MTAVSVYDLTDEQVDRIVAARQSHVNGGLTPEWDLAWVQRIVDEEAARERERVRRAEIDRLRSLRRCSRCGIDTTEPDLCRDCWDVEPTFGCWIKGA